METMSQTRHLQHLHACQECGRPFYLCSARDCGIAPEVCQACEMDRMDHYLNQPLLPLATKESPKHESR